MTSTYNGIAPSPSKSEIPKKTLVVISHTHWDREWYLTFQQYRFKLVRLVDRLLNILENDPEYLYFMLDGQTIVLEDYLEVRPEKRQEIARLVQSGRLLVGPWYVLADQFLVSGEAHIQNLLRGLRTAAEFGPPMRVGYIPDPFGHIGQMPQILRGFGIDSAVFWRGIGPELGQIEFIWVAPDGSQVDGVHLPGNSNVGGYCTAVAWNSGVDAALAQLQGVKEMLVDKAQSGAVLLMNGNDHVEPSADFPANLRLIQAAFDRQAMPYQAVHGTLPLYLEMARRSGIWQQSETPRHQGEFRDSRLAHLLPGVLSSRMPIKQWNARVEHLLELEAGAAIAWTASLPRGTQPASFDSASLQALYRTAWKYLLQNQPHDSICGCSIDQVHDEMSPRFAQAEQIGQELLLEGWRTLANQVNTRLDDEPKAVPLVVFNPVPAWRTETATVYISAPEGLADVTLTDATGQSLPFRMEDTQQEMLFNMDIPAFALAGMTGQAGDEGRIMDYTMAALEFSPDSALKVVDVRVLALYQSAAPTDPALMQSAMQEVEKYIAAGVETFRLAVYRQTSAKFEFLAPDLPPTGYKTFYLRPRLADETPGAPTSSKDLNFIENEFYKLRVDQDSGLFTVLDKITGITYPGLNRFRDSSDAGDEYNYAPASFDTVVHKFAGQPTIKISNSPMSSSIEVSASLNLPASLTPDRQSRNEESVACPVTVRAVLTPGLRRIDFETSIENNALDHRLQVLFSAPFAVEASQAEQAFDVVRRPVELPAFNADWREDPVPTAPQKTFVSVHDPVKNLGLTVMNQGLPEYEIVPAGAEPAAIALTLLRCVGWLSRSDLSTRRDHAGPGLATPGAQLTGRHIFHYAIMPHAGDWLEAGAQQQAHCFNHPLQGIMTAQQVGSLPAAASFVEIQPEQIALSTIKPSEDGLAVIVRIWNPSEQTLAGAKLRFYRQPARIRLTNLAEDTYLEELEPDTAGWTAFNLPARRIATLRVEF